MKLTVTKYEDERRVLTEYIKDIPFRRAKVIEVKTKSTIGSHYHLKSDSVFYILKGKAKMSLWASYAPKSKAKVHSRWLFEGDCELVRRETVHEFEVYPGTIMLETATEPYDQTDEIPPLE